MNIKNINWKRIFRLLNNDFKQNKRSVIGTQKYFYVRLDTRLKIRRRNQNKDAEVTRGFFYTVISSRKYDKRYHSN